MKTTVSFIQRHSRPLDYLLWEHSRGEDRRAAVLDVLAAYQNDDGGFAWAIEPDNFSEASTPIGVWKATTALRRIDCYDRDVPLVRRAVDYLRATRRADGRWAATDPATNVAPHAPWWEDRGPEQRVWGVNPTADLLGYLLRLGLDVQADAMRLIQEYVAGGPLSMTELPCVMTLYDDLTALGMEHPAGFRDRIAADLELLLEPDPTNWARYVVRPSMVFRAGHEEFAAPYAELIEREKQYLRDTVQPDGSWEPNWSWADYPEQWAVAKNWSKAILAREHLEFLAR